MLKLKKIISTVAAVALAISLTGCYGAGEEINMATSLGYSPFEYLDGEKLCGIDVDIAAYVAKEVNSELEITTVSADAVIDEVKSGKYDMAMAAISSDDERISEGVLVTDVYATSEQVVVVSNKSVIFSPGGLVGKKIGYINNSAGGVYAAEVNNAEGFSYEKGSDAVRELLAGKVNAVIMDKEIASVYVDENSELRILEKSLGQKSFVIVVSEYKPELFEQVKETLNSMEENGTLKKIISKYVAAE